MTSAAGRCNYLGNILLKGFTLSGYPYKVLTNGVIVVTKGYTPSKGLRFWPKITPPAVNVEILYTRCFIRGIGILPRGFGLGKSTHTDVTLVKRGNFGQNRRIKWNGKNRNVLILLKCHRDVTPVEKFSEINLTNQSSYLVGCR